VRRFGAMILAFGLVPGFSCRARETSEAAGASEPSPAPAVSIRTAPARLANLERVASAPGHTVALVEEKIRVPFAGTLLTLSVTDGDRVRRGDSVGTIVSRDSEAALNGAREMEREAKTPVEHSDAARARALAERNLIRAEVRAPTDGVVLSHAAAPGDRVTDDQEILTLAEPGSIAFVADVPQTDLARIRPGQRASIDLAGRPQPALGVVHDVLPMASASDFTAPVRIDLIHPEAVPAVGLFGTVRIVVAEKANAVVVPDAAVLRDDVTGKARIARVRDGHAHWEEVVPGLSGAAGTEIVSPALTPGDEVVVEGLVGLPDGSAVVPKP
jgi:multidrug efflux pump subunit AcrA (membrane-fusion protein)